MYKETAAGTTTDNSAGVLTIDALAVGGRIYIGWSTITTGGDQIAAIVLLNTANSDDTHFTLEYWNGTEFKGLPAHRQATSGVASSDGVLLGSTTNYIYFTPPNDWATSTRAYGGAVYWLRFVVKGAAIDAACEISALPIMKYSDSTATAVIGPVANTVFGSRPTVLAVSAFTGNTVPIILGHSGREGIAAVLANGSSVSLTGSFDPSLPPTCAYVNYDDANYITTPHGIYKVGASLLGAISPTSVTPAAVDSSYAITGAGKAYDPNYILQDAAFPKAQYLAYHQSRFWATGIEGQPHRVVWSAAAPAHKVWPSLQFEYVVEGSNLPISGMAPLGENMIVYKPDSIHQMVFQGMSEAPPLPVYMAKTIAHGVGCVSNASIADVHGTHVFLSNAGLVQFNGGATRYISHKVVDNGERKIDRLQDLWPELSPGRYPYAVGVHWRSKNCYLIAVSRNGSGVNNLVIVWDYVRDAFWLWDGLEVAGWFFEDFEQRVLCYSDTNGRLFRLAGGSDFGTAISAYVTTTRLGYQEQESTSLRSIEVEGTNDGTSITATPYANDEPLTAGTIVMKDPLEAVYGTGKFGTAKWRTRKPRLRRMGFWSTAKYHQIKFAVSSKNSRFTLASVKLSYNVVGRR
jgi:hypothetical protein